MKIFFSVLFIAVLGVTSYSYAIDKITIKCNGENVNSPALPSPPELPEPPAPPILPSAPIPPAPPMLPAIPEIVIPAQAHLACVGKKSGTEITWEYANKSTMTGVCGERNGKPYLKLSHVLVSSSFSQ